MRYWVYINEKVEGPYEETDLVTLQGFTSDTQICTEESASSGEQKWQKASDVFEFDETPVETPEPATTLPLLDKSAPVDIASVTKASTADAAVLLKKLDSLNSEVLNLQTKLDSMQKHLDSVLEENKQFAKQAAQTAAQQAVRRVSKHQETRKDAPQEKQAAVETSDKITYPSQAEPMEDEMVIRSALDSIYGGNPEDDGKAAVQEDAFQELLPETTNKSADEIAAELEFIPVKEDVSNQDLPEVQEAVITTPSLDEAEKDALINELTASPKEDILDQIIQEHQHEEMAEKSSAAGTAGLAAAGLAAAGLAAKFVSSSDQSTQKDASFQIAPDKDNPDKLEDVLPAQDMPQDAPAAATQADDPSFLDLPGLEATMHEVSVAEMQEANQQKSDEKEQASPSVQTEEAAQPTEESAQAEENLAQPAEEITPAEEPVAEEIAQKTEEPVDAIAPIDLSSLTGDVAQAEPAAQPTEEAVQPTEEAAQAEENLAQPAEEITPAEEPVAEKIAPAEEPVAEEIAPAEEPVAGPASDLPSLDSMSAPLPQTEQTQEEPAVIANLPGLDSVGQPDPVLPEAPEPQTPQWQEEDSMEELVKPQGVDVETAESLGSGPEGTLEPLEPQAFAMPEADTAENSLQQETQQDEQKVSEEVQSQLTGIDLAVPAFSTAEATSVTDAPVDNPNDLTEIELNEGSTYLISDFVPPAQLTDDVAVVMNSTQARNQNTGEEENKKTESSFQDMLVPSTNQSSTPLSSGGLPADVATTGNLENTIQAKRGPSMDIKTVPVVPEPGKEGRLNVNDLNDVNAQHDVKRSGSNSMKILFGAFGLLVAVILYALLGLMHLLPDSVNIFGGKKAAVSQSAAEAASSAAEATQEFLPEDEPEAEPAAEAEPTPSDLAQTKVQEFPLPNGYLLQGFISSKHPLASSEDISWTTTDAVEADNYSVIVKVPPENPQSLQTAYRFNYNMITGILNPTNSDAKNLLDQAYGKVQTSAKKTVAKKGKSKKSSSRKK